MVDYIMNGNLKILFILPFLFVSITETTEAYGHSLFNSAEQTLGNYRVQIATLPEFPQIGDLENLYMARNVKLTDIWRMDGTWMKHGGAFLFTRFL